MTTPTDTTPATISRDAEKFAAALVLAAVRGRNGDLEHEDTSLLRTAAEMARQGNVAEILVDLAQGYAASVQPHIDSGTVTVDDVQHLLKESIGTSVVQVSAA